MVLFLLLLCRDVLLKEHSWEAYRWGWSWTQRFWDHVQIYDLLLKFLVSNNGKSALMALDFYCTLVALAADSWMDLWNSICRMAIIFELVPWICNFDLLPGLVHDGSFLGFYSRLDRLQAFLRTFYGLLCRCLHLYSLFWLSPSRWFWYRTSSYWWRLHGSPWNSWMIFC